MVPFSLIMKKRDPAHPMSSLNTRVGQNPERELKVNQQIICLTLDKFALVGKISKIDTRKQMVQVQFDKASEESKLHDPFIGQKHISALYSQNNNEIERARSFFGD